jgi:hypothetical protein
MVRNLPSRFGTVIRRRSRDFVCVYTSMVSWCAHTHEKPLIRDGSIYDARTMRPTHTETTTDDGLGEKPLATPLAQLFRLEPVCKV